MDDLVLVSIGEFGVDGDREGSLAGFLGVRELARAIAQIRKGLLQVEAEGIVDFGRNAGEAERFPELVTVRGANGELIVDVVVGGRGVRRHRRQHRDSWRGKS